MFGSNFPVDSLSSTYTELVSRLQKLIPDAHQNSVFQDTAKRFYRLE
jgi:predicted TIM-barrel fold metal-dependent hydrolase